MRDEENGILQKNTRFTLEHSSFYSLRNPIGWKNLIQSHMCNNPRTAQM